MSSQYNYGAELQRLKTIIGEKKEKPIVSNKVSLDWKHAELHLSAKINNQDILTPIIQMQKECLKHKISCFYSYFLMQKALSDPSAAQMITKQAEDIGQAKSKYHQIKAYIKIRQQLLAKINQFTGTNIKSLFEDIDDIRFLNFQIIASIKAWKLQWKVLAQQEPVFYDYNTNYLLKINNDNADMINLANFKKTKFISPPNPFFLSEDGNIQGMSSKQKQDIDDSMDVLNKERALDVKMSIEGGIFIMKSGGKAIKQSTSQSVLVRERSQGSFIREAKNQMQSIKQQQIRNIYKINKSLEMAKRRVTKEKEYQNSHLRKMALEQNGTQHVVLHRSEKFIKASVTDNIKQRIINENKVHQSKINRYIHEHPAKSIELKDKQEDTSRMKQSSKILREQVHKKIKQIYSPAVTVKKGFKEIKPKMKIIEEKQSNVEDNAKNVWDFITSELPRPLSRKNSSFYKKIQPIVEQSQDNVNSNLIKPVTQSQKRKSLTHTNFSLKRPLRRDNVEKREKSSLDLINQMSKAKVQHPRSEEEEIRNMNSHIRNLTIVNIYKAKSKARKQKPISHSSIKHQYPASPQQRLVSSYITVMGKEQSIEKSNLKNKLRNLQQQQANQISRLSKQVQRKGLKKVKTEQLLQDKQYKREEVQVKLDQKVGMIRQLQGRIKELQDKKRQSKGRREVEERARRQMQKERKLNKIENKLYKTKLQQQEQQFLKGKELELIKKQQDIQKQLRTSIQHLQQQNIQKKQLLQEKLLQEQIKIKEAEKLILEQKSKYKEVEHELEQKKLKEKLLKKIIEEKELKLKEEELYQNQEMMIKKINGQLEENKLLQEENWNILEEEKGRMKAIYEEMVYKNNSMELLNNRKIQQLQDLDAAYTKELQQIKNLQQSFNQEALHYNQQMILEHYSTNQEKQEDFEDLKSKIKSELIEEMKKKRQIEEEQQKQQGDRRLMRLKKIEEQVAEALRAEEQELQRQNDNFMKKVQQMKDRHQIQANLQNYQNLQSRLEEVEKQKEENQEKKVQAQANQLAFYEMQRRQDSQQVSESKANDRTDRLLNGAQHANGQSAQEQHIENTHRLEQKRTDQMEQKGIDQVEQKRGQTSQSCIDQAQKNEKGQKAQGQKVWVRGEQNQQRNDLMNKFKKLSQFMKKTKQLLIQDSHIGTFIDSFLSHLEKPARQMLPYTKVELEKIFLSKKVDIFEFNCLGWLQEKGKYNLLGGIECLDAVIKKYGAVQINQLFIFDKNSPYQKQYLAKKIKVFQNIGFVYQKKMQGSSNFSVRFIIKVPKEMSKQPLPMKISIQSTLRLQNYQDSTEPLHKNHTSFSYLLSRALKENSSSHSIEVIQESSLPFEKCLQKQMGIGPLLSNYRHLQTEIINDIMEMNVNLNLKYFRNYERAYYLLKCSQYSIDDNHYYVSVVEEGLAILLHEYRQISLPLDQILYNTLPRVEAASKLGEIDICLPIWEARSASFEQESGLKYYHQQSLKFDMPLSSICSTFLIKHRHIEIRPPFAFSICEVKEGRLMRPLSGQVVLQHQLIHQHLKLQ